MAWTTITGTEDDLDEAIATFEGTVTSIDGFSVTSHKDNQLVALIEYSA